MITLATRPMTTGKQRRRVTLTPSSPSALMPSPGDAMRSTINQIQAVAPVLGASLAGCAWWVIAVAAALTVFLHGADPATKWLDVIERVRSGRAH
jgi:hypothetical protein